MNNLAHTEPHPVSHYINIWFGVLFLFVISITAAQISTSRPLVLVISFGIALVQAYLVAAYFMHLKGEKPYIHYLLYSMIVALTLLYLGTMNDLQKPAGQHWTATDAMQIIKDHTAAESDNKPGEHSQAQ